MNHRLISPRQKAKSRHGRHRRNARRQRCSRRQRLLFNLHGDCGALLESQLSPVEAVQVLFGHGNSARRLVHRAVRSSAAAFGGAVAPIIEATFHQIDRPGRCLRWSRCGVISAGLADSRPLIPLPASIEAAIESLQQARVTSIKEITVLCSFVAATLLRPAFAADVLFARGILPRQLSAGEINAVERANEFWRRYDDGRNRYRAACTAAELETASGDWALFSPFGLCTLLAGIRIPIAFRRTEYAANLTHQGDELWLDIHSMPRLLPLFYHPLGRSESVVAVDCESSEPIRILESQQDKAPARIPDIR